IITGRVLDVTGRPLAGQLIEIWQANAAGRYAHKADQHNAPLDANFFGGGRCLTDNHGRYRFSTVKPGAYPWGNHDNAWRPNHIHLSLFGPSLESRLVTQMYFPGDPLLDLDPIYLGIPEVARHRLVSKFSLDVTEPGFALGYEFDIVLAGASQTPLEA
ncbi:MAG: protocatechuate 3,4-dioxygenase subunit beta, partial [Rhizobiales bacterium]|nr:protocatechuate 3,4-dioxygenase subunit beta [Hyphomicrobiales bacterium]